MDYINEVLVSNKNLEEQFKKVFMLAEIENKTPETILKDTATTYLATLIKPRYKDYDLYFQSGGRIAGLTMANVQKGKKAWKDGSHGIKNQISQLFETYEVDDINKDIINKSCELVKMSLDHVFLKGSDKKRSDFEQYITHNDFLFVMLQLSVKLLGTQLYLSGVDMENKTLEYVSKMMETHKRKFSKMFSQAISSRSNEEFQLVCEEYRTDLANMLNDYMKREVQAGTTMKVASKPGEETKLLEQVGIENVHIFLGYLVQQLRFRVQETFSFNKMLPTFETSELNIKY